MTPTVSVHVRYIGADFAVEHPGPDDRLVHTFQITPLDQTESMPAIGPCGLATAELDHGVTIDVDPMIPAGLIRASVEVLGLSLVDLGSVSDDESDRAGAEALSAGARDLVTDLFGAEVVETLADPDRLAAVGAVEQVEAETGRWETARRLAHIEAEARRHDAPTGAVPSLWAAEAARQAQLLSPALEAWARIRAGHGAQLLGLLPPESVGETFGPLLPQISELVDVASFLTGDPGLETLIEAFRRPPPDITDMGALLEALEADTPVPVRGAPSRTERPPDETGAQVILANAVEGLIESGSVKATVDRTERTVSFTGHLSAAARQIADSKNGKRQLGDLAARCWAVEDAVVLGEAGIRLAGGEALAEIHLPASIDSFRGALSVEVLRRGHDDRLPPLQRAADRAMLNSRHALGVTQVAATDHIEATELGLRRARQAWRAAAKSWEAVGVDDLADRCRELEKCCGSGSSSPAADEVARELRELLPQPLATDLLRPGIRLLLERQTTGLSRALRSADAGESVSEMLARASTLAHLTRTVGLLRQSTELTVVANRVCADRGLPVTESQLVDALWDAMSLSDAPSHLAETALRLIEDDDNSG